MKWKYLAVFLLPRPQPEHANIPKLIEQFSDGDFKQAFRFGGIKEGVTVAYVFTSSYPPWEIPTAKTLLNGDEVLITEITDRHYVSGGLGIAARWWKDHPLE